MTAIRTINGSASLRSCIHFPPIELSKLLNPVMLPPGRDKLCTKPDSTGSEMFTNMIGITLVPFLSAAAVGVERATNTSGLSMTNSRANASARAALLPAKRTSTRMLCPSIQPSSVSPCRNAANSTWPAASSSAKDTSIPTCRTRSAGCARPARGQAIGQPAVATLPTPAMNSRRFIRPPRRRWQGRRYRRSAGHDKLPATRGGPPSRPRRAPI